MKSSNILAIILLMPGLIESHGHLFGLGQSQLGLNLRGIKTKEAVFERISEYASSLKEGEWLIGQGWDQSDWPGQAFPTAKELDQILPDNHIFQKLSSYPPLNQFYSGTYLTRCHNVVLYAMILSHCSFSCCSLIISCS